MRNKIINIFNKSRLFLIRESAKQRGIDSLIKLMLRDTEAYSLEKMDKPRTYVSYFG